MTSSGFWQAYNVECSQACTVSVRLGEDTRDPTRIERHTDVSMSKECNWVDECAFLEVSVDSIPARALFSSRISGLR